MITLPFCKLLLCIYYISLFFFYEYAGNLTGSEYNIMTWAGP